MESIFKQNLGEKKKERKKPHLKLSNYPLVLFGIDYIPGKEIIQGKLFQRTQ